MRTQILQLLLFIILMMPCMAESKGYFLHMNGLPTQGGLIIAQTHPAASVKVDGNPVQINEGGYFMFGFGRFDENDKEIAITYQANTYKTVVAVNTRDFPTEVIDGLPANKVNPPESVYQQIKNDNVKVAKARSFITKSDHFLQSFIWPSKGRVSGVYGSRRILNGQPKRPHYGMDIANKTGTEVVAPAAGVVRLAETGMYYTGGTIIIDHGYGLTSTYLHMSELNVKPGMSVKQGDKIGEIGMTGRATGPHLDWRINLGKTRLDPQLIIAPEYDG